MLYGVPVNMVDSSKVDVSSADFDKVNVLSCIFLLDVLCSFREDAEDFRPMERCFTCSHYLRFLREMEEEEEKFFGEVDKMRSGESEF